MNNYAVAAIAVLQVYETLATGGAKAEADKILAMLITAMATAPVTPP